MKIFAFIFSFYLLFLAIEPGLKAMSKSESQQSGCCNDKSCEPIEKKLPAKQSEKKEGTDNKVCNPFQFCKSCIGFNADIKLVAFTLVILFAKPQADNKVKVPPQITLDFWQPPKIA
jgi:hypothetical protein